MVLVNREAEIAFRALGAALEGMVALSRPIPPPPMYDADRAVLAASGSTWRKFTAYGWERFLRSK